MSSAHHEAVFQRFEQAWRIGPPPVLEDYLPADPGARRAVLAELVQIDMEHRFKAGEPARVESYWQRYPELAEGRDTVLSLVAAEYGLRQRFAPDATVQEYQKRFPDLRDELEAILVPREGCGRQTGTAAWPTLPGYEIVGELGRGGMGIVYQARQTALKRLVALKMILAGAHADRQELLRFKAEAEAVARLQHPNVVQIYEVGEQDGRPYFSLEFVAGGSLAQAIARGAWKAAARDAPLRAAELVETLARAIHYCHQRGVIHRDLKPANILLQQKSGAQDRRAGKAEPEGSNAQATAGAPGVDLALQAGAFEAKVTDFGLAKQLESDLGQTQTGAVLGTPSYMAPEQAAGQTRQIGPATDIYALGTILYELLTGQPPFRGATLLETLEQVRSHEPVPPTQRRSGVPRDLETVCLKCLAKEPGRRYASALALAQDLERFRLGEAILARPDGLAGKVWRKARRYRVAVATSLAIAATLAVAAVVFLLSGEVRQKARVDRAVTEAHQAIDAGPPLGAWTAAHLARMDDLVAELEQLAGPAEAAAARERVHKQFHQVLGGWIQAPRLDDQGLARIEQALVLLAARDEAGAGKLRQDLKNRLQDWQTVFDLPPDPVDTVFAPDSGVTWDGSRLRLPLPPEDTKPEARPNVRVLSRHLSPKDARLEAVFDESWEQAAEIGLLLNVNRGHSQAILSLGFSQDGQTLVSAGGAPDRPGEVIVWDLARGRERAAYRPKKAGVLSASLSPDGTRLAVGNSGEARVHFLDPATGAVVGGFTADPTGVGWLMYSPDGKLLATGTGVPARSGAVSLWDPATGEKKSTLGGLKSPVARLTFSPDGKLLAAASEDRRIVIWEVATGQVRLSTVPVHLNFVSCGRFSPDSRHFVAPAHIDEKAPGKIAVPALRWDADTNRVHSFPVAGAASGLSALAFAPDGKTLATANAWNWSVFLQNEAGGAIRTFVQTVAPTHRIFTALEFAPDGRALAVADDDHAIRLWDVASGNLRADLHKSSYNLMLTSNAAATPKQGSAEAPPPLSAVRANGGAFSLKIAGPGGLLRERHEPSGRIPSGPLRLTASRAQGRLSLQVNDLPLLEFEDPLAPGGEAATGVFGLSCPAGLALRKLSASRLTLPPTASPLERGDDLYAQAQFVEALAWYQEQARTAGSAAIGQEARTKAALCLAALRRDAESTALLERVAAEDDARWSIVAGAELVTARGREGRLAEAAAVLEALVKRHGPDKLATLFPLQNRSGLVLGLTADFDKLNLYLARNDGKVLHNLERARAIQEAFRDPHAARLPVQQALLHAYHLAGRLDEARAVAEDLLTNRQYWRDGFDESQRARLVVSSSWILRQSGVPARALARVDDYRAGMPAGDRPEALTLLLERARVHVALGLPNEAEKDIEEFFRSPSRRRDYLVFSQACLLRGFLREQRGDAAGALAAWREGVYENWYRAVYQPVLVTPDRSLSEAPGKWLLGGLILASLAGELSDAQAQDILLRLTSHLGSGGAAGLYQKAVLRVPPAILREMCRTARGHDAARHLAFQDVSYAHYLRTPALLIAAEVLHQGALPGPLSPDQGALVWDLTEKLHGAYAENKLASSQFFQLALAWKGTTNFLGWGGVAPTLDPALRGPLAYVMGHRYRRVGRPQDAAPFFRTAVQDAAPASALGRLARAEVEPGTKK